MRIPCCITAVFRYLVILTRTASYVITTDVPRMPETRLSASLEAESVDTGKRIGAAGEHEPTRMDGGLAVRGAFGIDP